MTDPISTILSTLSGLANAASGIANASDKTKRNEQLIEFQKAVIGMQSNLATIQADNAALAAKNRDLEQELTSLNAWEKDSERYSLVNPWGGAAVYALKSMESKSEHPHWLCANCYQNQKKSILTLVDGERSFTKVVCPVCKAQFQSPYRGQIPAKFAEEYTAGE